MIALNDLNCENDAKIITVGKVYQIIKRLQDIDNDHYLIQVPL